MTSASFALRSIFPSSWSLSSASATKLFEMDPARKRVSAPTGVPFATSALPTPPSQKTSSLETSARPTPGIPASASTFPISAVSESTVRGAALASSARAPEPSTIEKMMT